MDQWSLYHQLMSSVDDDCKIVDVVMGINWSYLVLENKLQPGICFSATDVARTLSWSGTLRGRSLGDVKSWVKQWEPAAATVGLMAINAYMNSTDGLLKHANSLSQLFADVPGNLQVFEFFKPKTAHKSVTVIGHYPGLQSRPGFEHWQCIERVPKVGDLPDPAAFFTLPESDWVFITGAAIANKTLPAILQLCHGANVVLMGPSVAWTHLWKDYGVDYLAGTACLSLPKLNRVASEAGGTELFQGACEYRVIKL